MLSLTIAGGIFLLDYKIKEHIDSTRLQGSKEEVLGGRLLLRNCHNKDKILGKVKIGRTLEDNSFSRIGKLGSYAFAQFLPIASGLWEPGAAHRPTVRP